MKDSIFPETKKVGEVELSTGGLTKREYFALQFLLKAPCIIEGHMKDAIENADRFLRFLNEK